MSNRKNNSPLRYPGGKACLTNFLAEIAFKNDIIGGTYVEPYAGGAGAALNLLFDGIFSQIHINDYDLGIYSIWHSILNNTEEFIRLIANTNVTINEWHKQKEIYEKGKENDTLTFGFATFYLNRTNRSGIIYKAGPIGGLNQEGDYKIDVRFNKQLLIRRIEKIGSYRDKIKISSLDAIQILNNIKATEIHKDEIFIYLDPPYYNKGKYLYLNNYDNENHLNLSKTISQLNDYKWLISYDNSDEITKLYKAYRMSSFALNYTLQSKKFGSELLVFSPTLVLNDYITVNSRQSLLKFF